MPTSEAPDPFRGGDQLRSLENDRFAQRRPGNLEGLAGRKELDRAQEFEVPLPYRANAAHHFSVRPVLVFAIIVGIAALWTYLLIL